MQSSCECRQSEDQGHDELEHNRLRQQTDKTSSGNVAGHPEGGTYGEAEISALWEHGTKDEAKKRQEIPTEARTPKERLASAIEQYSDDTPAQGPHGIHRTH